MIYQRIDFNGFQNAFDRYGRSEQFTSTGLQMLFNYIEELSNDTGQDIALDVIALCCQYSEYTLEEFLNDYKPDGIDSIESLEESLKGYGYETDCVIAYDIDNNVILVTDY